LVPSGCSSTRSSWFQFVPTTRGALEVHSRSLRGTKGALNFVSACVSASARVGVRVASLQVRQQFFPGHVLATTAVTVSPSIVIHDGVHSATRTPYGAVAGRERAQRGRPRASEQARSRAIERARVRGSWRKEERDGAIEQGRVRETLGGWVDE
jgi:hypothetical protein